MLHIYCEDSIMKLTDLKGKGKKEEDWKYDR
jgi:hypothetical protein